MPSSLPSIIQLTLIIHLIQRAVLVKKVDSSIESMDGDLELLEKIFQQLEREIEQKAQEQLTGPGFYLGHSPDGRPASSLAIKRRRYRQRASISISRIGQPVEGASTVDNKRPTTPSLMKITSNSPFFQTQLANASTGSIASGASAYSNDHAHSEDDTHVTQMHHIAARPSISSRIIPRQLSWLQSTRIIPPTSAQTMESSVIIDVSVQKAMVESVCEDDGPVVTRSQHTTVQATSSLTKVSNSVSNIGWLAKARALFMF